ncbi:MAG: Flagellar biosynthetic protein FliQ [Chlamydiales bacterium]|nr:Flagellar biosynthetic protein FliQ [Chlamydiales bacterium]MCH9620477.1 Flagellar biosynthetic protein FliQ [Chlamydiales bacterium]MCH9623462.1 Flagellar biosynthetic protein FliQ [Chlamydiales bacterium]
MTPEQITQLVRQTLYIALEIAAPFLLLALVVGLVISILQAVTHVQEITLSFVPKMLVVGLSIAIFFPWMLKMLTKFTNNLLIHQWDKVTHYVHYVLQ